MPKLPRLKPKKLIKILRQSGFSVDHISGSHYILYKDNSCPPITVPFHNKDLKTGTLSAILKQAKISVSELIDLI
jgi:predicted RNA binding protein YcfA (HicA-like mRNA interferase family)